MGQTGQTGKKGQTDQPFRLYFQGNLCGAAFTILAMFNFWLLPKLGGGVDHWSLSCFYDLFAQMLERGGGLLWQSVKVYIFQMKVDVCRITE